MVATDGFHTQCDHINILLHFLHPVLCPAHVFGGWLVVQFPRSREPRVFRLPRFGLPDFFSSVKLMFCFSGAQIWITTTPLARIPKSFLHLASPFMSCPFPHGILLKFWAHPLPRLRPFSCPVVGTPLSTSSIARAHLWHE